jgi:sugar-phosphatase
MREREHVMHARAVLFDFDGVLVDSVAAVERAWGQWAREHGLDPATVLAHAHGVRTAETVRMLTPHLDADGEAARIEEREVHHTGDVHAYPGAAALLADLPAGAWAIVTSGTYRLAAARLDATGLPVPDVFVTADDVDAGKPAPDPYLVAAERLGVPPEQCVVVEDSPAGAAAGRSAGMRVVTVLTTHTADRFDEPTVMVDSVAAIQVTGGDDGVLRISTRGAR